MHDHIRVNTSSYRAVGIYEILWDAVHAGILKIHTHGGNEVFSTASLPGMSLN